MDFFLSAQVLTATSCWPHCPRVPLALEGRKVRWLKAMHEAKTSVTESLQG